MKVMNQCIAFGLASSLCGLLVLTGCGGPSNSQNRTYVQVDRLARPAVNEVFATVAGGRHQVNDQNRPIDDVGQLTTDIQSFMGPGTAINRSQAITDAVKSVLAPDVIVADLSKTGVAGYLGVETGAAVGTVFGGRALADDIVDVSLAVIMGGAIPAITGVPDDGREAALAPFISDHVGPGGKHFTNTFPYLGSPR